MEKVMMLFLLFLYFLKFLLRKSIPFVKWKKLSPFNVQKM